MKVYTFSTQYLADIIGHAANLEIGVASLALDAGVYTMTTEQPFDADQFDHLQSFSDIEEAA